MAKSCLDQSYKSIMFLLSNHGYGLIFASYLLTNNREAIIVSAFSVNNNIWQHHRA